MKIIHLNHLMVTIPQGKEDEGRAFYCGVLGLPEIEKPRALQGRGGFWLQVGAQQVHIGTEDGIERDHTKAHVAYQVDDLAAWGQHLAAHGFLIGNSVPIPNYVRFEVRDPFGNRVELLQALTDA